MDLLNAYVDESIHDDHGLYVIAAILATPSTGTRIATDLQAVLPMDRLPHWHIEDNATRAKLVGVTASLDVEARVYGCRFREPRRKEAARARALGWFLVDLDLHLDELVLDRRQDSQNRKDQRLFAALLPGSRTTYRHATSAAEPLLWVADIVAGAVCASWLRGADHLNTLSPVLKVCEREPG